MLHQVQMYRNRESEQLPKAIVNNRLSVNFLFAAEKIPQKG
jgi:hypothetical protein